MSKPSKEQVAMSFESSKGPKHVQVNPVNKAPYYDSQRERNPEFRVVLRGSKLQCNTTWLSGRLAVMKNDAEMPVSEMITVNPRVGAHSLIDSVITETELSGQIDSINEYSRHVSQLNLVNTDDVDRGCHLSTSIQMLGANHKQVVPYLRGIDQAGASQALRSTPFAIPLKNCLNRCNKGALISARQTGVITLKLTLSDFRDAFASADVATADLSQYEFRIYDLKFNYIAVPDDGMDQAVTMQGVSSAHRVLETIEENPEFQMPARNCYGVVCSLLSDAHRHELLYDQNALEFCPGKPDRDSDGSEFYGFEEVRFEFNDVENNITTYKVESREKVIENGILAARMDPTRFLDPMSYKIDRDSFSAHNMYNPYQSDGYIFGLSFGQMIDLSRNKISVNLKSEITNAEPFYIFLYAMNLHQLPASPSTQTAQDRLPAV